MRRADRLFQITQILRGRRLTTAAHLAERLGVSERTIYRDVADLSTSGVPVEGEAGVGYRLRPGFDLPPLMFSADELAALALGARIVGAKGGSELALHATSALEKISAAVGPALRIRLETTALHVPDFNITPGTQHIETLRHAVDRRLRIAFDYADEEGTRTTRFAWPLGLFFWGQVWTLGAWCELREDFRSFRLDRLLKLELPGDHFPDTEGRRLADLLRYCHAS
ncbi:YafY family transcriptional regulator [Niveibacterium sp. 24ML]|uniref:helix-turn-helix transcriptional regulator n=1 Tax=Niveibacterium sp. 24ML TaxID=2985512 RepID=UPI0022718BD7|nr:YafY family protein [Niveibacterium sp. 24ML]MCX9157350.1 YafY family transcriptional regulator [Niveibacterium sp. 24ML]